MSDIQMSILQDATSRMEKGIRFQVYWIMIILICFNGEDKQIDVKLCYNIHDLRKKEKKVLLFRL